MMDERLLGLLSLCRRAGKLMVGFEPALESAAKGDAALILTACDLSPKSHARLLTKLSALESPPRVAALPFTMEELSRITHRLTGICTVCDAGFAGGIEKLMMTDDEEDTTV